MTVLLAAASSSIMEVFVRCSRTSGLQMTFGRVLLLVASNKTLLAFHSGAHSAPVEMKLKALRA